MSAFGSGGDLGALGGSPEREQRLLGSYVGGVSASDYELGGLGWGAG